MEADERNIPVYPIGVVQKLTALSGRQIRYYEQVGLIRPERTQGNQRLFSPAEVDRLLKVKSLLAAGLNIEGVKSRLEADDAVVAPDIQDEAKAETSGEPPVRHESIDHDYIFTQMRAGVRLASLYPVNNQAALAQMLEARRAERERKKP